MLLLRPGLRFRLHLPYLLTYLCLVHLPSACQHLPACLAGPRPRCQMGHLRTAHSGSPLPLPAPGNLAVAMPLGRGAELPLAVCLVLTIFCNETR